jgi:adenylate cyclase
VGAPPGRAQETTVTGEAQGRWSDRAVYASMGVLVTVTTLLSSAVGIVVVFALFLWVFPTDFGADPGHTIVRNLVGAAVYAVLAAVYATWRVLRRQRPGRAWLREDRAPTSAELRTFLRAPIHVAAAVATGWVLGAITFGVWNATVAIDLGVRVGLTTLLAGLTTTSVSYLLAERLVRPAAKRAMNRTAPDEAALPGVMARLSLTWLLVSGAPLLGLLAVAISSLVFETFPADRMAVTILVLAATALVLGLAMVLLAARSVAKPIVGLRRAMARVTDGDLEVEVDIDDGSELGLLQSGFNEMVAGLREREHLRDLFGRHVGEDVARRAVESGVELGGETRELAVLFVDLVGSTALAAQRPPHEVVELLNRFFTAVVEVVEAEDGWVNKFEGDAALVIFGAPRAHDDPAGAALAAARTLHARLVGETPEVAVGIGVSFGTVVAGNIGAEHRLEYTVIGDAVNVAARLTDLAKEHDPPLLTTTTTLEAASESEAGRWRALDAVQLRGRDVRTQLAGPRPDP